MIIRKQELLVLGLILSISVRSHAAEEEMKEIDGIIASMKEVDLPDYTPYQYDPDLEPLFVWQQKIHEKLSPFIDQIAPLLKNCEDQEKKDQSVQEILELYHHPVPIRAVLDLDIAWPIALRVVVSSQDENFLEVCLAHSETDPNRWLNHFAVYAAAENPNLLERLLNDSRTVGPEEGLKKVARYRSQVISALVYACHDKRGEGLVRLRDILEKFISHPKIYLPLQCDGPGETPLHALARLKNNPQIDVIAPILLQNFYPNVQNSRVGDTALHVAVSEGNEMGVRILLNDERTDCFLPNYQTEQNPIDLAFMYDDPRFERFGHSKQSTETIISLLGQSVIKKRIQLKQALAAGECVKECPNELLNLIIEFTTGTKFSGQKA